MEELENEIKIEQFWKWIKLSNKKLWNNFENETTKINYGTGWKWNISKTH